MYTSRDKIEWERDAAYNYYKHGPLSRTVLGQLQVQGLDYAYTLQGWLKGVNGTTAGDGSYDMGKDGLVVGGDAPPVARDIFGFGLHYYDDGDDEMDYKIIGTAGSTGMFARPNNNAFKSLYNGNIAGMSVNNAGLLKDQSATANTIPMFYNYRYDQLNRIKSMDAYGGLNTANNQWNPVHTDNYAEAVSYDPNGNILTYNRKGSTVGSKPLQMDDLTYSYTAATNKLRHVKDAIGDANYTEDIDNQPDDNYDYDAIGNLIKDTKEGITNINWTVYGKIASIEKGESIINYTYDASGNRVTKTANNKTTVYVRDASGNVMSVYEREGVGAMQQTEVHLYGSSRIGMATLLNKPVTHEDLDGGFGTANLSTFTRGEKLFELSNHLGNVLATVNDKKIGVDGNTDGTIDYYTADVVTATDYYPGGMLMPGRKFSSSSYRYGFNGKENDNEVKGEGNWQDYGERMYDSRLVRFPSVDPVTAKYPELTPYQFASNRPIDGIDEDGLEWSPVYAKDDKDHTNPIDYSWVGYNNDGTQKAGSVASAFLNKGDFSFRYSSDASARSGKINVYSNTAQPTYRGWWTDMSTAYNYNINISSKFGGGLQGRWSYIQTAQVNDPVSGTSSQGEFVGASNDKADPNGVRSSAMFAEMKRVFGLVPPPTSIESVYPETLFIPIGPEIQGLNIAGRIAKKIGQLEIPVYRVFGGSSRVFGESWTFISPKLYGRFYRNFAGLPNWNSGSFLVKGTVKLSEINSFRMALPLHGNIGRFAPELIIKEAKDKVIIKALNVTKF